MLLSAEDIKKISAALDIDQIGVTSAEPLAEMRKILDRRISEKRLTSFEEKNPELRLTPSHLLKGCRSIITLAVPYLPAPKPAFEKVAEPRGLVARCARGRDYHRVAEQKAAGLVKKIAQKSTGTFQYRILADRSPLVEREIARRSGVGLIGENCCLINPVYGSYVALCTILLDARLKADQPVEKVCLQCGRCREACPTGALPEPYTIDPSRCLSYLTQASGVFPRALRSLLGGRLYGCDCCQEVCPLNSDIFCSPLPEMIYEFFPAQPLLLPLLSITRREFDLTIGLSAAGWRGKTTLQRNAVLALGNSGDPAVLLPLTRLLENDRRPLIRSHAAWAVSRFKSREALKALEKSAVRDPASEVRAEARQALTDSGY